MNEERLDKYLGFAKWLVAAVVIIVVVPQMKDCCNCSGNKYPLTEKPSGTSAPAVAPKPVNSLEDIPINEKGIYTTPSKKKRIINHKPAPPDEDPDATSSLQVNDSKYLYASLLPELLEPKGNQICDADGCPEHCNYDGVKRKAAKTSISKGQKVTYSSVADFLVKFADKHPDGDMPDIIKSSNGRVQLEDFNATITKAWLFCFSKESDEDYHVVIGTKKNINDPSNRFIIVEIGGLPESGSDRSALTDAQSQFFKIIGDPVCESGYFWFDDGNDPVPVTVSGSIYWDIEHWSKKKNSMGTHGPSELRDRLTTVWEIHPVTQIKELE